MRILLTGASGFVGSAVFAAATRSGHTVLGFSRKVPVNFPSMNHSSLMIPASLEHPPWKEIESFQPELVIHAAWNATPGSYLESPLNEFYQKWSLAFVQNLLERGIHRIMILGSCIEYASSGQPKRESFSPLVPDSAYGRAKHALHETLQTDPRFREISLLWGRVFYPYGPSEDPSRTITQFLQTLASGKTLELKTPDAIKDWIYIDDLAQAILHLATSQATGCFNLATGVPHSIQAVAECCRKIVGSNASIVTAHPLKKDMHDFILADITKLQATQWTPRVDLSEGIKRMAQALNIGLT